MKGIFGRSPKLADRADDMYNGDDQWRRDGLGPVNGEGATPYGIPGDAWSDGSPLPGRSPVTGQSSFGRGSRDQREGLREDDRAAQLQKRDSLLQAQRIVDAERRAAMDSAGRPRAAFDPDNDVPWSPRQVVESGDEEEGPDGWGGLKEGRVPDHRQTRSPPGRKPVPTLETLQKMPEAQRVKVAEEVDPDDALSKLEGRLTPAQR